MTIPLNRASYVDDNNRLGMIKVSGLDMSSDVSTAVTAASMSFSATQVGQFSMTVIDSPDAQLLTSGMFGPGTLIDWADQHLEVRSIDFQSGGGGPQLAVKARSRSISTLRGAGQSGKASWGDCDVSQWVRDRCGEGGATAVVQPDLGRQTITRQQNEGTVQTTWDVMQALAKTVGCVCYEFEQVVTFARPSWLTDISRARRWELVWNGNGSYTAGMVGFPSYSWSADSTPPGEESLSVELLSDDADQARPGDRLILAGSVGMAYGLWMLVDVTIPLSTTAPVKVTCKRATDPAPVASTMGV